MRKTWKQLVCASLSAVLLAGEIPAQVIRAAGVDADQQIIESVGNDYTTTDETFPEKGVTLLPAQLREDLQEIKDSGEVYEESYFVTGTGQADVKESGKYAITIYRVGNTDKESSVSVKSVDYSASYGKDYVIADDRYVTKVVGMEKTLIELAADPEKQAEGARAMDELMEEGQGSDDDISDAGISDDAVTEDVSEADSEEELNVSAAPQASADDPSSLAELKQAETGKPTRETTEPEETTDEDTQFLEAFLDEYGLVNVGDYIEYAAITEIKFAPGETEKQLIFEILEDKKSEGDELIQFSLVDAAEGDYVLEPNMSSVMILDDEPRERSQMSFSEKAYTLNDSGTKIRIIREGASYNMMTATLLISNQTTKGDDAIEEIGLSPYQTELEIELKFNAGSKGADYRLLLTDIKGGDPGSITEATLHVPGTSRNSNEAIESDNSGEELPDALGTAEDDEALESVGNEAAGDGAQIKIDGHVYTLKATDQKGVYDIWSSPNDRILDRKEPVPTGVYYAAASDYFRYKNCYHGEGSDPVMQWDSNNEYFNLEYYDWRAGREGRTTQAISIPMRRYSGILLDYTATSNYTGSVIRFAIDHGTVFDQIRGINKSWGMRKGLKVTNYQNFDGDYDKPIAERQLMGPIRMTQSFSYEGEPGRNSDAKTIRDIGPVPNMGNQNLKFEISASRESFGCIRPGVHVYGVACMYKAVKFNLINPKPLTYKKADGSTVSQLPARVNLQDDHKRFFDEPMTIAVEQNDDDIRVPKGRIKGWNITPKDGTQFYVSREDAATGRVDWLSKDGMTFKVTDQFIDALTSHGIRVSNGDLTSEGYDMEVDIQPVFDYIDVHVRVLPSDGKGTFSSDAIKQQKEYVFHVGDERDFRGTPEAGWYYSGYSMAIYRNYDDTQAMKAGKTYTTPLSVKLGSEERYDIKPVFNQNPNAIEIRFDEEAKKYFEIQGLCSDNELPEILKNRNILKIEKHLNKDDPAYAPQAGDAYEIRLINTPENDGMYRPKFTIEYTGQVINGYVTDIVAGAQAESNVINVTAERVDPSDYKYFEISSKAIYSSAKLRYADGEKTTEPAVDIDVYAGGIPIKGYDKNHNSAQILARNSGITNSDGYFAITPFKAIPGDIVSVRFDNGDRQQVKYVKLPASLSGISPALKSFGELVADDAHAEMKMEERTNVKTYVVRPESMGMPVISPRSPEVVKLTYEYDADAMRPTSNNVVDLRAKEQIRVSAEINDKGTHISGVKFIVYDKDGNLKDNEESLQNGVQSGNIYTAKFSVDKGITAGDTLYVQIESSEYDEVTYYDDGTAVKQKVYRQYPKLNSGLVFGKLVERADPVTFSIVPPKNDAIQKLPVLGEMGSGMIANTGSLTFNKTYLNDTNQATSPFFLTVGISLSRKELIEQKKVLDEINNGKSQAAKTDARQKAADIIGNNDPETLANKQEQEVYTKINASGKSDQEKQAAKRIEDQAVKDRIYKDQRKKQLPDSIAKLNKKYEDDEHVWPNLDFRLTVMFQLAFFHDDKANEYYFAGGQFMVGGAVAYKRVWHTLWQEVIPLYIAFELEFFASIDGRWVTDRAKQDFERFEKTKALEDYLTPEAPWMTVGTKAKFMPGAGIYGVVGARGKFELKGCFRWACGDVVESSKTGVLLSFGGGIAVDLIAFKFEYNTPKATYRGGVYNENKKLEKTGDGPDESSGLAAFDLSEEEISYLGTDGAGEDVLEDTGLGIKVPENIDKQMILVDKAAEYVRPGIVYNEDGSKRFITYLTKKNGTTRIAYAVDNGTGRFSKEALVDPKGSGMDTTNDLLFLDDKVYIAWTNAKKQVESKSAGSEDEDVSIKDAKDALQSMNLKLAVYDFATGSMSDPIDVTNDNFINGNVRLYAEKDHIVLYYYKKDIAKVETVTQLVSEKSNYTTWTKAEYDINSGKLVNFGTDAEPDYDQFITITKPVNDPIVLDYSSAVYTSKTSRNWRMTLYTVDRNLNSKADDPNAKGTGGVDAEIWLSVVDLDKDTEPVSLKIAEGNVTDARLNVLSNSLLVTWLEDAKILYSVSAGDLMAEDENGVTCVEHIAKNDDHEVTVDGETYTDKYVLPTDSVVFADDDEDVSLSQYRVISGDDGHNYLFALAPGNGVEEFGQEIWGTSYYSGSRNDDGTRTDPDERTGWGQLVQITDYNQVIDEMNLDVDKNHKVTILANMYESIVDNKGLTTKNYKLVELDCVPVTSLAFSEEPQFLEEEEYFTVSQEEGEAEAEGPFANPYPLAGEKATIGFTLVNNGLLPANSYRIELYQDQNGKKTQAAEPLVVTPDSGNIFTGEEETFYFDVTLPESIDNLSYTVAVTEFEQGNESVEYGTVESKLDVEIAHDLEQYSLRSVSGYTLKETCDYLKKRYTSYKEAGLTDVEAADSILSTLDDGQITNVIDLIYLTNSDAISGLMSKISAGQVNIDVENWYSVVDFMNFGNASAKNIKATVTQIFNDGTRGEVLGEGKTDLIDARDIGAIVIPYSIENGEVFDRNGLMNLAVDVTVDGEDLDYSISQIVYTTKNAGLTCENAQDNIDMAIGENKKLNIVAHPFNDRAELKYYSYDPQVVSIDDMGIITAVGTGSAEIVVEDSYSEGLDAQAMFTVTVHNSVTLPENKFTFDSVDNDATLYLLKGGKYTFEEGFEVTPSVKGAVSLNKKNGKFTVKKDTELTLKKGDVTKTVKVKLVTIKKKPVALCSRDTVFNLAEVFTGAGELLPDSADGKYLCGIAGDAKGILKQLYTPTPDEEYATLENFTFGTTGAAGSATVYAVFGGKTYKSTVKCTGYPVLENPSDNLVRTLKDNVLTYDSVNDNDTLLLLKNGKYTLESGVELSMADPYRNAIKVSEDRKTGARKLTLKKEAIVKLTKDGESKTIAVNLVTIKKRSKVLKAKGESVTLADLYEGAFELIPDSLEDGEYNNYAISVTDKKGALAIRKNNFPAIASGDNVSLSDFAILHSGNKGSATVQVSFGGVVQKATVSCK